VLGTSEALKLCLRFAGDALHGPANGGGGDQVGFKRIMEARVEALKNGDLYVDKKSELSGERWKGFVAVGDRFKKVVDSDCGVSRFGSTLIDAVIVCFAAPRRIDDVLISR